jgi:predicted unusual protein kinase regulating ubiquinone biosynthesis (AarF/ABC1/UbiB family)
MSNTDEIPTSKVSRAAQFMKTGAQVGGSYLSHRVQKAFGGKPSEAKLGERVATDLMTNMVKLRGTGLKLLQMMSLDNQVLPESMRGVLAQSQHSVPPMSGPLVRKVFRASVGKDPEQVFDRFEPEAIRAASLGQVHRAWLAGQPLAVKIQYPGVADSVRTDLKMAKSLAKNALRAMPRSVVNFHPSEIDPYFQELEDRLLEEVDYRIELRNSLEFSQLCANVSGVYFPPYFPELSSDRVLTMGWMEGVHLQEFLAKAPDEALRRQVGQAMWNYYEFQIHQLQRMNTDTHPGNFLIRPDGNLVVLDFGNTKTVPPDLYRDFSALTHPKFCEHPDEAELTFERLDLLRPSDSPKLRDQIRSLFSRLFELAARPYVLGRFNFNSPEWYEELKVLSDEFRLMPDPRGSKDLMFINRAFLGLHAFLRELDVEIDTRPQHWGVSPWEPVGLGQAQRAQPALADA